MSNDGSDRGITGAESTAYPSGALSDTGQRRRANEDTLLPPFGVPWDDEATVTVFAVADGVGGAVGGAVASATAIERFAEVFRQETSWDPGERLRQAILAANAAVIERWNADPTLRGMATTMVAAAILGRRIWYANVGDSRGYLLQAGDFYQVTVDHSFVSDAVRAGLIAPEEAGSRPERHVINRSLGSAEQVEVDVFGPVRFMSGDIALLCSDGLHDAVPDATIEATLRAYPPDQAAAELVRLANEAGGPDNITVAVVQHA